MEAGTLERRRACRTCAVELVLGENWSEGSRKHRNYVCLKCACECSKGWQRTNPEKVAAANRKWARANREKSNTISRDGQRRRSGSGRTREAAIGDRPGTIYCLVHPRFPGFCKVGMSITPDNRLKQYQTGCPRNEYSFAWTVEVRRRRSVEHELLNHLYHVRQGGTEWVQAHPNDVKLFLEKVLRDLGEVQTNDANEI